MLLMSKRPEASMRLCAATCCKLSLQTVANSSSVLPQPSQEDLRTANFLATLLADTDKDVSAKAMQRLHAHISFRTVCPMLVPGITETLAQILPRNCQGDSRRRAGGRRPRQTRPWSRGPLASGDRGGHQCSGLCDARNSLLPPERQSYCSHPQRHYNCSRTHSWLPFPSSP